VKAVLEFLKGLGAPRLTAMIAVAAILIGFFAVVMVRVTSPDMVPLFADLPLTDSAAVVKSLEAQGIKYELKGNGTTIFVPAGNVAAARMRLAEQGLPSGGGVGWEIFDKGDGLSATSFLQNVNRLRALEGELSRSIRSIDRVQAARVHLVIPERPLFSRDAPKPTASIVLKVAGELSSGQVRAIQHLTASAVQGLEPQNISIVDETGRLLADGSEQDPAGMPRGAQEREIAYEKRMKDQVESIVESIVGRSRARAEVSASFDYSKITQTADNYDPNSRVVRSTQTHDENSESKETNDTVSVGNELPNAQADKGNKGTTETNNKSEETINYEISRTTRTQVQEAPRLKRLSVAVLVDGIYTNGPNGAVYTPRSQEELDRIAALVRTAIGYDQSRGDQVEVVNLRFAQPPSMQAIDEESGIALLGFTKDDVMRMAEMLILGIVSLLVLFLVVRPLVARILAPEKLAAPAAQPVALPPPPEEPAETPALPGMPDPTAQKIDLAQVNGRVHAQTISRVGELVQRNPNETVSIIRQWLTEAA